MSANDRRPIPSRSSRWAGAIARALAGAGIPPNVISASSLAFAALAAAALLLAPSHGAWLYPVAALGILLRVLANLFDGMVAVEYARASPGGPLWNEVPDRIADVAILAAAGYGAALASDNALIAGWGGAAGWLAACAALLTAYAREFGRALGAPADYGGPFAKQQRMAVVAGAALISAVEGAWGGAGEILFIAIAGVALGTLFTAQRRLARLAAFLRVSRPPA